jgi:hypothetical protein
MSDISTLKNVKVAASVPYAQTAIFNNLQAGINKRGTILTINRYKYYIAYFLLS